MNSSRVVSSAAHTLRADAKVGLRCLPLNHCLMAALFSPALVARPAAVIWGSLSITAFSLIRKGSVMLVWSDMGILYYRTRERAFGKKLDLYGDLLLSQRLWSSLLMKCAITRGVSELSRERLFSAQTVATEPVGLLGRRDPAAQH